MGVYEIITGITKNEENLKVEIRQTEGTLERNLVYIKNTKTNRAYSFTLADGDEYGADAMTRNAVAKLHSDMYGYPDDDTHVDLSNTTDKELKAIEICFREQED